MIIDCALYEKGERHPGPLSLDEAHYMITYKYKLEELDAFIWLGMYEPDEVEFDSVRRLFNLHELAVEAAIKAHQRPKLEVYGDSLFVVLKTVRFLEERDDEAEGWVDFGEIMVFVGEGFVVSARHTPNSNLRGVRRQLEGRPDLLRLGPAAVLYEIINRVLQDFRDVIDRVDEGVRHVERQVFSAAGTDPAHLIYFLTREVIDLHQATAPLAEALDDLSNGRISLVHKELRPYFREVSDRLERIVERIEGSRDLLKSALEANLTHVGVRQNEDMRKISAWVAVAAAPAAIASVVSMGASLGHAPELSWVLTFPLALALSAAACVLLYRVFKRNRWL
jgi:magnesium transporter